MRDGKPLTTVISTTSTGPTSDSKDQEFELVEKNPQKFRNSEIQKFQKWTPTTSNILAEHQQEIENAPESTTCEEVERTMLGFSSFLIGIKSVTLIVYLVLLIVSVILLDNSFFYTILAFGCAELVLIIITIYHGIRSTLKVVFAMLGFEMALSLVKLVFAIVLMAKDGGQDCSADHPCAILTISEKERFGLFFFILFTAFCDGLTALLTIANSPQMHEFELGDEGRKNANEPPRETRISYSLGFSWTTRIASSPPSLQLTTMPSLKKSNPTEVHISTSRDLVQRTLVFRNTTGKDFLLKLIASSDAISFPTNVFRFPPLSHRVIQFRVASSKLSQWDKSKLSIKGYVVPVYAKNLKQFIDQKTTVGTTCQEAFALSVKFTDQFSAPQTIINLPGSATCIESTDHPVDVEELDTATAVNIERDVVTAAPIGSLMGFVEEYKKGQKAKGCWLSNYICGGPTADKEKPSMRSRRSSRSSNRSAKSQASCRSQARKKNKDVNVCLEATPCGGSTIQA
ncbi:hypothetical protein B9Z55_011238 [Caenorhabditis nigoni]|uniref:Major sperm protein n=1 Tax=Caenorhabditis nigoni TaxID=1611254 RepID=A0A2G5UJ77_9PELO|nr:hypothetical protein B9Z55_011238 [Caenorhabditis nigoni]